jgi:hypothetical protein
MDEAVAPGENMSVKFRITAAAGLVLAVAALSFFSLVLGPTGQASNVVHSCYPVDKQFINSAQLNMAMLGQTSEDYLRGSAKPEEVIDQADSALRALKNTRPADPSLTRTKMVLRAMFLEYRKAIQANAHHHSPGKHIYRAYGLANFAHDLLVHEQAPLMKRGCDVSPLL